MPTTLLLSALLAFAPSHAATLAGVTLPDSATVGGSSLVLNGMGLREKYYIDIYVGGLYLPAKTTDANKAINDDVAKRIDMRFLYGLDAGKLRGTFEEGLNKLPDDQKAALGPRFATLSGYMQSVDDGDVCVLDYVPGQGTTISFNGTTKGTIEGADFMRAIWTIYLGPNPPTKNLKKGLMGG